MTFTDSPKSKAPEEFRVVHYPNILAFVREMKEHSKTIIDDKEKSWLWIPSTFDPTKGRGGYRTQKNFVASFFLVLDFDGGDLTPEAFEDIFWRKAKRGQRHPFIIHNSFNRRAENPNKFHVILPYKRPARSFEEHRAVYDYIVSRLEEAGYTEETSGLDHASKGANQPFWIPTINRAHPDFAFFRTFGTRSRDFNRLALDPSLCPKEEWSSPSEKEAMIRIPPSREKLMERIEAAELSLWNMSHNRHRPFFEYAVLLAQAGLDEFEIEAKLEDAAGSEPHMRKKVAGAMRSLRKYRWI